LIASNDELAERDRSITQRIEQMARIIVVTSGKGGVGKTTTSASFAAGLALAGHKTAVIDFDVGLRNLDLIMGCERRVVYDLINVIQGDANLHQALIKDKQCDNLCVLAASQTRDKEALIPALIIPVFFFAVNIGQLKSVFEKQTGIDYKAFLLPLSIITTVSGVTRASALVTDIQGGYFDRLLLTPVRRITLLLGLMVADLLLVAALCVPVLALGFIVGVRAETGVPGLLLFVVIAALWGLA
jgi:hypothetical protein